MVDAVEGEQGDLKMRRQFWPAGYGERGERTLTSFLSGRVAPKRLTIFGFGRGAERESGGG